MLACPPKGNAKAKVGLRRTRTPARRNEFRIENIIPHTSYAILPCMEWLRAHPYTSAISAAVLLVFVGAYIVISRASQPAGTSPTSWGGEAVPFLDPTSYPIGEDTSNGAGAPQDAQTITGRVQD